MKPSHWTAVLMAGALSVGAQALEGVLPPAKKDQISQGSWTENCAGTWQVNYIVRDYNRWEKIKIAIDSRLSIGHSLTEYKSENICVLDSVEKLAKKLNANVYVIRDFLYIATELPPGVEISIGNGKTAPPTPVVKEAKKPEPPAPPPPPPPPPPPAGKQPPKPGQKPPPNAPKQPAVAPDKPLSPLKPITPDSGLAELTAIFPGLRPGTSTHIGWSHKSMKDAAADGKPIVLLSYFYPVDPKNPTPDEKSLQTKFDKENKDAANFFETLILEDPEVLTELTGKFSFILIPWNEPADNWPATYSDAAKQEGGALFLLPADASRPVLQWQQRNPTYTAKELIKVAKALESGTVKPAKPEPAKPVVANVDPAKKGNPADPADPAQQVKDMMKKDPPKNPNKGDKVKDE
jgi:hypothetical protein